MEKRFGDQLYDLQYRDDGSVLPPCCLACLCYEGESRARARRRCKSEGLERSPYEVSPCPLDWQKNNRNPQYTSPYAAFPGRQEPRKLPQCPVALSKAHHVKSPNKIRETKINSHSPVRPSSDNLVQYGVCNINGDSLRSRCSPVKTVCPSAVVCNGRRNFCCESPYAKTSSKFIENEEPRLSELGEFKDALVQIVEPRPHSTDLVQYNKTPLKSILVNNSRRSASPSFFRKSTKGKPPPDWSEVNGRQTVEGKRRVRARSESEKNMCLVANDSCKYGSCCSTVLKRARGKSPPPLSIHQTHSTKELLGNHYSVYNPKSCSATSNGRRNQTIQCRDIGVGEWSVFDGVTVASSYRNQHPSKPASSKVQVVKGKQPSAKVKSKLQAIKAKKASMETCSTGSELSDDELSDTEDAASKASMDRDSDISVEPADHQECLTSDSGPSVSSVSDSASLNGLTSALSVGAVVSQDQDWVSAMLRPSLFARVPPYLRFRPHDAAPARPPLAVARHLRWRLTTITPVVVRRTLLASGFKLVRSECDTQGESMEWIGTWGKHMKSICFKTLKDSQKMNHFPGTFQIGRKDRLWRNLHKLMSKFGIREFGLMPKTYVLPHDLKALKHDWEKYAAQNEKWIIKPPASARGTGIKVVSRWTQIPKRRPVVVQRYISRPLLIDGSKFDMRLYVLVTSVHPLRIYLYPDGLARFASVKYSEENNSLHDRYMHLTNYSINRLSKTYTHNQDAEACQGHKWTLQALMSYLRKERGIDTDKLWSSMKDLVIKTIISGESSISCLTKSNLGSRFNCYELFGIDVLLDENLKPWLLEVNISPSLHSASPLDLHVKGPLVSTLLNMAQFHMPEKVNVDNLDKEKGPYLHDKRLYTVHLSKEEKLKHTYFTEIDNRMDYISDILSNLTPDDVRHLIQSEDEFTQRNNLERIFPTADSNHYLDFFAGPRYYNRLFDAWEHKYSTNRSAGIKRLQDLCERGYHLEVPPTPAKNEDERESSEPRLPPPELIFTATDDTTAEPSLGVQVMDPSQCPHELKVTEPSYNQVKEPSPMETVSIDSLDTNCSSKGHHCTVEGHHILGEICLVCRPLNLLQQDSQPLPVQQQA